MISEYRPRLIDQMLDRRVQHHPAVLVLGPRAVGKTTTARRLAQSVVDLADPDRAQVIRHDPDAVLRGLPEPILIDEWQLVPEVLQVVKRAVDSEPRPGRFIITGSVTGRYKGTTWPGTGRLIHTEMTGLAVSETRSSIVDIPFFDRLRTNGVGALASHPNEPLDLRDYVELAELGGFPEPVLRLPREERWPWLESYIEQLVTRDAAELHEERNAGLLRRFLSGYALNTAQVVELATLQEAAGISYRTASAYERVLIDLFAVAALPAWWSNRVKRLTKAPKRYVLDPSLAMVAQGVEVDDLMMSNRLLGSMVDTFVVAQLRAEATRATRSVQLHHLRQEQGRREVDVLVELGAGKVFGFEIKAGRAPTLQDARHLCWLRDELGDRFVGGAVLNTGPTPFELEDRIVAAPISAIWS